MTRVVGGYRGTNGRHGNTKERSRRGMSTIVRPHGAPIQFFVPGYIEPSEAPRRTRDHAQSFGPIVHHAEVDADKMAAYQVARDSHPVAGSNPVGHVSHVSPLQCPAQVHWHEVCTLPVTLVAWPLQLSTAVHSLKQLG